MERPTKRGDSSPTISCISPVAVPGCWPGTMPPLGVARQQQLSGAADELDRRDHAALDLGNGVGDLLRRVVPHQDVRAERRRSAGRGDPRRGLGEELDRVVAAVALLQYR